VEKKRELELLAYAKVCFDKCTSPFETMHLVKKNVTSNECRELSPKIGEIILDYLDWTFKDKTIEKAMAQAQKDFEETQK